MGISLAVLALLQGMALELSAHPQDSKSPVPDRATQEKLTKELQDLFETEYAKRDTKSRKAFAQKLLTDAGSNSNADQCFVMLAESRDLAAGAGDTDTAFGAIFQITEQYDVRSAGPEWSPTAQKVAVLEKVRKIVRSREAGPAIAEAYLTVARGGLEAGDYEAAGRAAKNAGNVARTAGNRVLATEAKALTNEIVALEKEFKDVLGAELKLSVNADDPDANLTVGRFYCFVKGDWETGLPCLVKGSGAGMKAMAVKELAKPKDVEGQVALADAWFELSKKEPSPISKGKQQVRAREWMSRHLRGRRGL